MNYLNIAFLAIFSICMISCGGEKSKITFIEETNPTEVTDEDEIIVEYEDETEHIEAAITALENGDKGLASTELMKAVNAIKSYIDELDEPSIATTAITELTKIANSIKGGASMTADQLQKSIMSLELFSEDELEIDVDDMDEEIIEDIDEDFEG